MTFRAPAVSGTDPARATSHVNETARDIPWTAGDAARKGVRAGTAISYTPGSRSSPLLRPEDMRASDLLLSFGCHPFPPVHAVHHCTHPECTPVYARNSPESRNL